MPKASIAVRTAYWALCFLLLGSAKGVMARLKDAASDGLNPSDYPVPDFAAATTPDALADADLKLTASTLDYARHAQSGRMHWSQVSGDIQYPEHPTDPAEVLANTSSANRASASTKSSECRAPTICNPTGIPAAVTPAGMLIAGCWVRLNG